jgi:hypothetical protein
MSFPSLLRLERYARIDLGIRIELPWEEVAAMTKSVNEQLDLDNGITAARKNRGPHCTVGRIRYKNGVEGLLLYIKSSLSGDERDYVLGYRKRYSHFPHETTGDQFFSEEQLEVYRALGFHAAERFFSGTDTFGWSDETWPDAAAARNAVKELIPTFAEGA